MLQDLADENCCKKGSSSTGEDSKEEGDAKSAPVEEGGFAQIVLDSDIDDDEDVMSDVLSEGCSAPE